jgi:GxxExxY protein
MVSTDDEIHQIAEGVIGCAIEVHRTLGPGLLESVYRECLLIELVANRFEVERERAVPIEYKGRPIRTGLRVDLLVSGKLIVELKAVEALHPIHSAQVITYLKLTGCPAGLLMNFNATTLRAGLKRLDHPDRYWKKQGNRDQESGKTRNKRIGD